MSHKGQHMICMSPDTITGDLATPCERQRRSTYSYNNCLAVPCLILFYCCFPLFYVWRSRSQATKTQLRTACSGSVPECTGNLGTARSRCAYSGNHSSAFRPADTIRGTCCVVLPSSLLRTSTRVVYLVPVVPYKLRHRSAPRRI